MLSQHLQQYAQEKYTARKPYYEPIWEELESGMKECTPQERILMEFLYGTMPLRDAGEYSFAVFKSYVTHALWLREHVEWCRRLEEDVFVHHVLYYRINSEDITDCRCFFYRQLKDRIAGMTLEEAVLEINYWCAENAVYQSTDGRTASPMTMYRSGKGRCGEESTFAVTAYRSVGIPARQVYTPRWAHCDDNHAWVEVYLQGKWHFLGACEPEEALDRGWFAAPASRALLVHSRTFSDFVGDSGEEAIGREDLLVYYNNTSHYAKTGLLKIRVKDTQGRAVEGAFIDFEILNMAEYSKAATLITDVKGEAAITLGLGDIRIRAGKDAMFGEKLVSLLSEQSVEICLDRKENGEGWVTDQWEEALLHAPAEYPMHPVELDEEEGERRDRKLKEAEEKREQRFAVCFREDLAEGYPQEEEMLRIAGENFPEVYGFLTRDDNPDRKRLLHSLAQKDYKDLKADILEDHLRGFCGGTAKGLTEEEETECLLCPRIYLEELTPYRSYIRKFFTQEEQARFMEEPLRIWQYIREQIHYTAQLDYRTICATPIGCLRLREGNHLAKRILFVAICRSLGIPARLNKVDMEPEYYDGAGFRCPCREDAGKETTQKAVLKLKANGEDQWDYYQNWTIGRFEEGSFHTLDYEGMSVKEAGESLLLEEGIYRVITVMRKPDGNQQAAQRCFYLKAGEEKQLLLQGWTQDIKELLVEQSLSHWMNQVSVKAEDGREELLAQVAGGTPLVLAFLGVGAEPTEHVLNELLGIAGDWNRSGIRMVLLLREKKDLNNTTLRKVLAAVKGLEVYFAGKSAAVEAAGRMQVDDTKLPVLIAVKEGHCGIYACSGYNVGSVTMLKKIMERLK